MWFSKRRGLATGIAVFGSGIGQLVTGVVLDTLLSNYGTQRALQVLAGYSGVVLLVAFFLLKRREPLKSDAGFCSGWGIFKDTDFVLLFLGSFFFFFGYLIPFALLPAYLEFNDIGGPKFSGVAIGLIGIGSAIGRIILGG